MADTQKSSTEESSAPAKPARDPNHVDPHHGNSVAAWSAVAVMLVGTTIAAFGVGVTSLVLFVVGCVVIALGAVVGKVLSGMGMGSGHTPHETGTR